MKITHLGQLDAGPYPTIWHASLTPETMAMLTDFPQHKLEGFFGAPSSVVGDLNIYAEEDLTWANVAEFMDESHEAIIPIQYRSDWLVDPKVDTTDPAIVAILEAMDTLKSRHGLTDWDFRDEDDEYFRVLRRYAKLHGYQVLSDSMSGQSQGDNLDVLHIIPAGHDPKETTLFHEVAPYWEGNAFCIQVILHSPFTDEEPFNEMLGFVVGRDQYILATAVEMVVDAVLQITNRK